MEWVKTLTWKQPLVTAKPPSLVLERWNDTETLSRTGKKLNELPVEILWTLLVGQVPYTRKDHFVHMFKMTRQRLHR